jgi:hypothetical protein
VSRRLAPRTDAAERRGEIQEDFKGLGGDTLTKLSIRALLTQSCEPAAASLDVGYGITLDGNMPSHGSLVLSDLAAHYLALVREPFGWRGGHTVARLLDKRGDANLTDRMPTRANCDKARTFSLYDRCKARYGLCP